MRTFTNTFDTFAILRVDAVATNSENIATLKDIILSFVYSGQSFGVIRLNQTNRMLNWFILNIENASQLFRYEYEWIVRSILIPIRFLGHL